jgi:sulfate/thiosulfate transport system ATP-binding protein
LSIEVRGVNKTFGKHSILRDVSLAVNRGELVALLGPSGSGKTTLLRIIAGLESPDADGKGSVLFDGKDVTFDGAGARRVGFVFQHYALFRNMTVFENVAFGLRVKPRASRPGEKQIREKVRELLSLIQLEGLAERYPAHLSGGQRQRVALARALAIEPQVLLLDEPFGALDAKVRQGLRLWLRRLHDTMHVTSLLVTHDQEEALEVADRVAVLNNGRIEQTGTPEEVFHHPVSGFVMDFMGAVNLFHGRIEQGKAVFGPLVLDSPSPGAAEGQSARLFVRPHEFTLSRQTGATPSLRARVIRVHSAGPRVRVELRSEAGDLLQVEMPHAEFREREIGRDDDVFVQLRDARIFTEDYSI